jgi:hypothetical protein
VRKKEEGIRREREKKKLHVVSEIKDPGRGSRTCTEINEQ